MSTTDHRRPSNLVRENTEPKPDIHKERQERAGEMEAKQEARAHQENEEAPDS